VRYASALDLTQILNRLLAESGGRRRCPITATRDDRRRSAIEQRARPFRQRNLHRAGASLIEQPIRQGAPARYFHHLS
jgi:hypothetical protein